MDRLRRAHGIVGVAPMRPPPPGGGSWSCSVCGTEHLIRSSWAMTYRSGTRELQFVLCRSCALARQPLRVVVDLTALERQRSDDVLVAFVGQVRMWRGGLTGSTLQLRDEDLPSLAERAGVEVEELVARWEQQGLATATGARTASPEPLGAVLVGG